MLQIKNLTLTHKKDLRIIIEKFNLVLNQGDKAVIIGEEGNGKSSIMKWLYDQEMIEDYMEWKGERVINAEKIAYLTQELPYEDSEKSVYEYFSEEESFWDRKPNELGSLAVSLGLEIDFYYLDQKMKNLSGGEKVKAQLLRLLIGRPTVLLLDEPSNDIDIETLKYLENLINGFEGIVLYVSHDETLIEKTANMIVHIEQLSRKTKSRYTVSRLTYKEYMENRRNNFEKQLQQSVNDEKEKKRRDEKYMRVYQSVEKAMASVSRQAPSEAKNLKDKMHSVKAMSKRYEKADENMTKRPEQETAIFFKLGSENSKMPAGKVVLEFEEEKLSIGENVLSENIKLYVRGPEKICIIGKNGTGKTTLLKAIAEILLNRKDLKTEYMPQNYEEKLDLEMTPVDYLDKSGEKEERTRIKTYLGALKYTTEEMEHPIKELSGGQKAKIFLLKLSMSDANVLILDEPTRNFSPLSGPVIRKMLKEYPGTIISISHDRKYIEEVCDKVYRLEKRGLSIEEKKEL
ncbi:MAG: ATP-binding cassette domain-containing protein [Lachnospiraceae bacterium]|nr:ATP-binding cassette domain-containing protein [Lachnospiraceae bacterium]